MRAANLLPLLLLAACETSPVTPPNPDAAVRDLATSDQSQSPLPDLAQSAPDQSQSPDLASSPGIPAVQWGKYQVGQNCQPIVPADPVQFFTDMFFVNNTDLAMGPFQVYGGSFRDKNGQKLATFALDPIRDFTVPPRGQQFIHLTKTASSASPANACMTLPCNGMVQYVIDWGRAGATATEHAASPLVSVGCVY